MAELKLHPEAEREIFDYLIAQLGERIREERLILRCEFCLSFQHLTCRLASALRRRARLERHLQREALAE
jgi:hypothetical protein